MYTGRFAPTPSGRLHFGSLIALLGAYLRAKSQQGRILLRIEDLDSARCSKELTIKMLSDLDTLGFSFDAPPKIQSDSQNRSRYLEVLKLLEQKGCTFRCSCTRDSLRHTPCTCHTRVLQSNSGFSVRFRPDPQSETEFTDALQGRVKTQSSSQFITLLRRDGIIAYNLACVVDDHDTGVTEVVRGRDLIAETPVQNAIYRALNWQTPAYLHLPLALQQEDRKFSKQNHAKAVLEDQTPQQALLSALDFLGQSTAGCGLNDDCRSILERAAGRFDLEKIPRRDTVFHY